jgi:hypothetical protein
MADLTRTLTQSQIDGIIGKYRQHIPPDADVMILYGAGPVRAEHSGKGGYASEAKPAFFVGCTDRRCMGQIDLTSKVESFIADAKAGSVRYQFEYESCREPSPLGTHRDRLCLMPFNFLLLWLK